MKIICVEFLDGRSAYYTSEIFKLLKNDNFVNSIIDANTGELLYYNQEK